MAFNDLVKSLGNSYSVQGWGMMIFKDTMKKLKNDLRKWNVKVYGCLNEAKLEKNKRDS